MKISFCFFNGKNLSTLLRDYLCMVLFYVHKRYIEKGNINLTQNDCLCIMENYTGKAKINLIGFSRA